MRIVRKPSYILIEDEKGNDQALFFGKGSIFPTEADAMKAAQVITAQAPAQTGGAADLIYNAAETARAADNAGKLSCLVYECQQIAVAFFENLEPGRYPIPADTYFFDCGQGEDFTAPALIAEHGQRPYLQGTTADIYSFETSDFMKLYDIVKAQVQE